MRTLLLLGTLFNLSTSFAGNKYPDLWWRPVPRAEAKWWEVLPQEADRSKNEVILSKRNELGILSNFAHTPFVFEGKRYRSVEGFWQMLKYPEDKNDDRAKYPGLTWKYTREEVSQMTAFDAKKAGGKASKNMEKMGINWVSYKGKKMTYRTLEKGDHYKLILAVMKEKVKQNKDVARILKATKGLTLLPDHKVNENDPPAWKYFKIYEGIRAGLNK